MKTNNKSGITLIALIITVIIMLILAGVSISALMGESGLFSQEKLAVNKYEEAVQNEEDIFQELINEIGTYLDTTPSTVVTIEKRDVAQTTFTLEATGADETSISKYEFYINGVLEETVNTTATTATINVTDKTAGNEYTCKVRVYDGANHFLESSELKVTSLGVGSVNTIASVNQIMNDTPVSHSNPIIPKGFKPIDANEAIWGSADGYKKGLVIEDVIGNQFVWVPVDGTIVTFDRCDFCEGTSLTYGSCSETVPTAISDSVDANGGFYIGRYEAGIATDMSKPTADTTNDYGDGTDKPVSKKDAEVWNWIQWGRSNDVDSPGKGAVTVARSMYTGSEYGVTSTLIYGTQWDTALKFIGAYEGGNTGYATDSTGMGNYAGTNGGDTTTAKPATCGLLDAFRQKNIYDMAGNVWELTMEAYRSDQRVCRGGGYSSYGSERPAAYRTELVFTSPGSSIGFRVGLYITEP